MCAQRNDGRVILAAAVSDCSQVAENSALVLFILKDSLVADIKDAKITINADARCLPIRVIYGKVSDFSFTSDIYAYTDNDGFFAGASFGGAVLAKTGDTPGPIAMMSTRQLGVLSQNIKGQWCRC